MVESYDKAITQLFLLLEHHLLRSHVLDKHQSSNEGPFRGPKVERVAQQIEQVPIV